MDLRGYLHALSKSWLIIAVLAIVGGGLAFTVYRVTPPTYASVVTFYVATPMNAQTNAQSAGQFAESRVGSYALLLQSERLANLVADDTNIPVEQIFQHITASAEPSTVLVSATVTNGSAARTGQIARDLAQAFPAMVDELDNQNADLTTVDVSVVSGPTATTHVAPSLKKYLVLGLVGGFVLGAVVALLRELLDVTVRSVETATALVDAPVIGAIDYDNATKKEPLIVGSAATSPRAEGFRQLRTNLRYIDSAEPTDVLVVTSSVPREGKSTVAADLALTLVQSGSKVLLIDGDLRRPSVADLFGLEPTIGLTNVLVGQIAASEAIQSWGTDGLDVLTSGGLPPNPSELLGGQRMERLMRELRDRYDKIILDAPPVLPVADALVASKLADGVLFVTRHGKTMRATVVNSARALHSVDARVVGTVLNMRRLSRRERRQYAAEGYGAVGGARSEIMATSDTPMLDARETGPRLLSNAHRGNLTAGNVARGSTGT